MHSIVGFTFHWLYVGKLAVSGFSRQAFHSAQNSFTTDAKNTIWIFGTSGCFLECKNGIAFAIHIF